MQRVRSASVCVDGAVVAEIGSGLLAFVGVARGDEARDAEELGGKLVHLRIFEDDAGRMNRSLCDSGGALCVVSQFTLLAKTGKGRRPFFGEAAAPEIAAPLVESVAETARAQGVSAVTGRFGARMEVALVNEGPVTLWLDTRS